jgi:hypothetical protein
MAEKGLDGDVEPQDGDDDEDSWAISQVICNFSSLYFANLL